MCSRCKNTDWLIVNENIWTLVQNHGLTLAENNVSISFWHCCSNMPLVFCTKFFNMPLVVFEELTMVLIRLKYMKIRAWLEHCVKIRPVLQPFSVGRASDGLWNAHRLDISRPCYDPVRAFLPDGKGLTQCFNHGFTLVDQWSRRIDSIGESE